MSTRKSSSPLMYLQQHRHQRTPAQPRGARNARKRREDLFRGPRSPLLPWGSCGAPGRVRTCGRRMRRTCHFVPLRTTPSESGCRSVPRHVARWPPGLKPRSTNGAHLAPRWHPMAPRERSAGQSRRYGLFRWFGGLGVLTISGLETAMLTKLRRQVLFSKRDGNGKRDPRKSWTMRVTRSWAWGGVS